MSSSTHFVFHHKVFSVEEGYFSSHGNGSSPCFNIPMGEIMASVPIGALRKEFGIPKESADARLLDLVERALHYVKIIRVNDAIPNELLDGSASWSVEERHGLIARNRLTLQLVSWVTGKKIQALDLDDFVRTLESPMEKEKVRDAIHQVSQRLGLADQGVAAVEKMIDLLSHELSYMEALRERFGVIRSIEYMLEEAAQSHGESYLIREDIDRIRILLSYAFTKIGSQFDLMDKQGESVFNVLSDLQTHIELIRSARDEIHHELMIWDEIVEKWQTFSFGNTSQVISFVVKDTYRFLAQNYPIVQVW